MTINLQKYARVKDWWSHILPPILLFFYIGISDSFYSVNKILLLTVSIIFLSILTAIIGYFLNDLFDMKEDLIAGKFNFVAAQSDNFKCSFVLLIILLIGLLYFFSLHFFTLYEQQIFKFFFILNVFLFVMYSAPPIRLKSNPFASLILDSLYSGTIFHVMSFLLTKNTAEKNILVIVLIFIFGFAKGIRNYLSHINIDYENDIKVGQNSLSKLYGKSKTQIIANLIYPIELILISIIIYINTPKTILIVLVITLVFLVRWFINFNKEKKSFIPELNDLYEIWIPLFLVVFIIYNNHSLYPLLIIHTILFPNYLDKIYFYTIFKLVGPLRKKRQ